MINSPKTMTTDKRRTGQTYKMLKVKELSGLYRPGLHQSFALDPLRGTDGLMTPTCNFFSSIQIFDRPIIVTHFNVLVYPFKNTFQSQGTSRSQGISLTPLLTLNFTSQKRKGKKRVKGLLTSRSHDTICSIQLILHQP